MNLSYSHDSETLLNNLQETFQILDHRFNHSEKQVDFTLKLADSDTSEVISQLTKIAQIRHFEETIPSVNEIFIQTVKGKET